MYISRAYIPFNSNDYATREELLAAFQAPYAWGPKAPITKWYSDTKFCWSGETYEIEAETNPKALQALKVASLPANFVPATDKQVSYIRKLSRKVGGGTIADRTEKALSGLLSKSEASHLIDDMLVEIN